MPYARIEEFAGDKACNVVVEEEIAPHYVRAFHAIRGRKVLKVEKNLGNYEQQRKYDLVDGVGTRWEIKSDPSGLRTGNAFIELRCLEHSEADLYLIFCGFGYVVATQALREAIRDLPETQGGDYGRATGKLLPLERLDEINEEVIAL